MEKAAMEAKVVDQRAEKEGKVVERTGGKVVERTGDKVVGSGVVDVSKDGENDEINLVFHVFVFYKNWKPVKID